MLTIPLMVLAGVYKGQGKLEEAEACYHRALIVREEALESQHSQTLEARAEYVALLRTMGQEEEAVWWEARLLRRE